MQLAYCLSNCLETLLQESSSVPSIPLDQGGDLRVAIHTILVGCLLSSLHMLSSADRCLWNRSFATTAHVMPILLR